MKKFLKFILTINTSLLSCMIIGFIFLFLFAFIVIFIFIPQAAKIIVIAIGVLVLGTAIYLLFKVISDLINEEKQRFF